MERRITKPEPADFESLRQGHFRCDLCNNWVEGKVPIQRVEEAIYRGTIIFEEFCRTGIEDKEFIEQGLPTDNRNIKQKRLNEVYPIPTLPKRTFRLNPWESEFLGRSSTADSLRSHFQALARFELPLDFAPHCFLIVLSTVVALCKEHNLVGFPYNGHDSYVLNHLKFRLNDITNDIKGDIGVTETDKLCKCYTPRHGNLGYDPFRSSGSTGPSADPSS